MVSEAVTGWGLVPFSDVVDRATVQIDPSTDSSGPYWYVGLEHISPHGAGVAEPQLIPSIAMLRSTKTRFRKGDVLFGRLRPYLAKVWLADRDGICSTDIFVLRPRSQLSNKFLYHLLRSPDVVDAIAALQRGAQLPRVSFNDMGSVRIPVPSVPDEQRRVVALLDELDVVTRAAGRAVDSTDELVLAGWVERFDGTPGRWAERTLGDNTVIESMAYGTNVRSSPAPDGVPVLRIPNIVGGEVRFTDLKYAPLSEEEAARVALRAGDVLLVRSNGNPEYLGRAAVYHGVPAGSAFASYLIRVRPRTEALNSEYLAAWFLSPDARMQILRGARTTAGQFNLATGALRTMRLPYPPLTMQEEFARFVWAVRDLRAALRDEQRALLDLRDSLVNHVFAVLPSISTPPVVPGPEHTTLRPIFARLSPDQQELWSAVNACRGTFSSDDVESVMTDRYGPAPRRQHLLATLNLLVALGVIIDSGPLAGQGWRHPDPELDEMRR